MRTLLPLTITLLLLPAAGGFSFLRAQSNWTPGYIVSTRGDTTSGLIDDQNWEYNPRQIRFKKKDSDAVVVYAPLDIAAFSVRYEHYFGHSTTVDKSPHRPGDLVLNPERFRLPDTVFLRGLVLGKTSLLFLKDEHDKNHFFVQKDTLLHELLNLKYAIEENGILKTRHKPQYRGQLLYYFGDCPELDSKIKRLNYSSSDLSAIVAKYNTCRGTASVLTTSRRDRFKFEMLAIAGISSTSLQVQSDVKYDIALASWDKASVKPAVGLAFNLRAPRNFGRFSWYNEIIRKAHAFRETIDSEPRTPETHRIVDIDLDFVYLKWSTFLRYQHVSNRKIQPFIQAGLSTATASFHYNATKTVDRKFFSTQTVTSESAVSVGNSSSEGGWGIGVGAFGWNRLGLEVRYESGNGFYNLLDISTRTHTFYFLVSSRLF